MSGVHAGEPTRAVYSDAVPDARHRYAEAGSEAAIDHAFVEVHALPGEPVTLDLSRTALLQVLAAELAETHQLDAFRHVAERPATTLVQQALVPTLRTNPRVRSALTLTWTAEQARDVAQRLLDYADVADADPHAEYIAEPARDEDLLHREETR